MAQLKKELEKVQEKLRKIADKFVMDDIDKATFDLLRKPVLEEENKLKQRYAQLEHADTNFIRYCNYGMSLLSHLDECYAGASPAVQKKLLGSIFTGKLVFEDGNYRTTGLNRAVELIGLFQRGLEDKKSGNTIDLENVSGDVPLLGQFQNF